MQKNNIQDQVSMNIVSEFLLKEFLNYYPFDSYQYLLESQREYNFSSLNFEINIELLDIKEDSDKIGIENTLWIATIRQRLFFMLNQLKIDKSQFSSINIFIKSVCKSREMYVVCKAIFKEKTKQPFQSKPINLIIKKSQKQFLNTL